MIIVTDIYGSLITNKQYETASQCAILSARNIVYIIDLLDANTERIYTSVDSVENCDNNSELATLLLP